MKVWAMNDPKAPHPSKLYQLTYPLYLPQEDRSGFPATYTLEGLPNPRTIATALRATLSSQLIKNILLHFRYDSTVNVP